MQQKKQLLKIKDLDSVLKDITLSANISESEKRQYVEKILAGPFLDLRSDWAFSPGRAMQVRLGPVPGGDAKAGGVRYGRPHPLLWLHHSP